MSPVEKRLFQDGFVDQYVKTVREFGDRRNILNSIANSPAARERIAMALGPPVTNMKGYGWSKRRGESDVSWGRDREVRIAGNNTAIAPNVTVLGAGGLGGGDLGI